MKIRFSKIISTFLLCLLFIPFFCVTVKAEEEKIKITINISLTSDGNVTFLDGVAEEGISVGFSDIDYDDPDYNGNSCTLSVEVPKYQAGVLSLEVSLYGAKKYEIRYSDKYTITEGGKCNIDNDTMQIEYDGNQDIVANISMIASINESAVENEDTGEVTYIGTYYGSNTQAEVSIYQGLVKEEVARNFWEQVKEQVTEFTSLIKLVINSALAFGITLSFLCVGYCGVRFAVMSCHPIQRRKTIIDVCAVLACTALLGAIKIVTIFIISTTM